MSDTSPKDQAAPLLGPEEAIAILQDSARQLRAGSDFARERDQWATTLDRIAATIDDLWKQLDALQHPKS